MCEYGPQLRPNYASPASSHCILEEVLSAHLSGNAIAHTTVDLEQTFDAGAGSRLRPCCSHKHFYHQVIRPLWSTSLFYRL